MDDFNIAKLKNKRLEAVVFIVGGIGALFIAINAYHNIKLNKLRIKKLQKEL